jgi:hypothetical protein
VKVLLDEHLPPRLARALAALFANEHEIVHLREKFGPGVRDIEWIETLSREGRWIIISADRRIARNKAELQAFRDSKLIGFFFSRGLYKSKFLKQAERLLALWDVITEISSRVEGGAMFELPMASTRLKQLKV